MRGNVLVLFGSLVALSAATLPAQTPPVSAAQGGIAALARNEYTLEMRRAGGARPEIVARILRTLGDANDPSWPVMVTESCRRRVVDCNDYLASAREFAERTGAPRAGGAAPYPALADEAELQRMSVEARHALYRKILTSPQLEDRGTGLTPADAGVRAINEGMVDLTPLARAVFERWRGGTKPELQASLAIVHALAAKQPVSALLLLVEQGVSSDVTAQLAPKVHRWPVRSNDFSLVAGVRAMEELRRLNPPGVEARLQGFLQRYDEVRSRVQRETSRTASTTKGPEAAPAPPPTAYLGAIGSRLAELIGDLGDRDVERRALGGRTLWDEVHAAEQEMIRQGTLKPSEAVTTAAS